MTDESYSFSTARTRLEEIVSQVRKKDTSLEKSLDLLEEGVRLANACTELIDHQDWMSSTEGTQGHDDSTGLADGEVTEPAQESVVVDGVAVIEDVIIQDEDGDFVAEVIEVSEYAETQDSSSADETRTDELGDEGAGDAGDSTATER